MFRNERPPSIDLYTPSPYPTERCPLFSPVPTQSVRWSLGSSAMAPIEYDP